MTCIRLTTSTQFLYRSCSYSKVPSRLNVFGSSVYVASKPDVVRSLFKNSSNLTFTTMKATILGNTFGAPSPICELYRSDQSGFGIKAKSSHPTDARKRVRRMEHMLIHDSLSKSSTAVLSKEYLQGLVDSLGNSASYTSSSWTEHPDLWLLMKDLMFANIVDCLYGSRLLSARPQFTHEFNEFDEGIHYLSKEIPRMIVPHAYDARDRCLESIKQWRSIELSEKRTKEEPNGWSSWFFNWRCQLYDGIDHLDPKARASFDLAFLWA